MSAKKSDEQRAAEQEQKAAEHVQEVAQHDAELLQEGVLGREADPKVGGESFGYGEVDPEAREAATGIPATGQSLDPDRDPHLDFVYAETVKQ